MGTLNKYTAHDGEEISLAPMHVNAMLARYRFLSNVQIEPDTGCWLWVGNVLEKGYGTFWIGGRNRRAHRWAYEHFVEVLPPTLVVDHLCRNRRCVNPDHLEPVTQKENVLRGDAHAARNARRTHCVHGHPLSGVNVYVKPNGARQCIVCRQQTDRKRGRHAHR